MVIDSSALIALLPRDEPVLFKGNDFSRTDLRIVIGP
jgi:uncharacterized protein with PIN domain